MIYRKTNSTINLGIAASLFLTTLTIIWLPEHTMAPNQDINSLTHKCVYSKIELLALQCKASKSFDFDFLKDPLLKDLKPHKRGKRGGVRLRMRRRKYKLPLPSIVLGNAQSLGNKCDELIACCKFQNEYREANLICFSETWLSPDQADPDLPGFNVYRLDRCSTTTGKKRGGGVCIFVNNRWCTNVTLKESFCEPDIELLSIALRRRCSVSRCRCSCPRSSACA